MQWSTQILHGIPHSDYVVKLGVHAYTIKPSYSLKNGKMLYSLCLVS